MNKDLTQVKKRGLAKAFLESGIRKHGDQLFPANGGRIRKTWGKGVSEEESFLNCFSFPATCVL